MKRVFMKIRDFIFGKKVKKYEEVERVITPFEFPLEMDDVLESESGIDAKEFRAKAKPTPWDVIDNSLEAHKKFKKESVRKELQMLLRNKILDEQSEKEKWMFRYLMQRSNRYISPTEVGRAYGKKVKGRDDYNSGHSRKVLLTFVHQRLALQNKDNHYMYKPLK